MFDSSVEECFRAGSWLWCRGHVRSTARSSDSEGGVTRSVGGHRESPCWWKVRTCSSTSPIGPIGPIHVHAKANHDTPCLCGDQGNRKQSTQLYFLESSPLNRVHVVCSDGPFSRVGEQDFMRPPIERKATDSIFRSNAGGSDRCGECIAAFETWD